MLMPADGGTCAGIRMFGGTDEFTAFGRICGWFTRGPPALETPGGSATPPMGLTVCAMGYIPEPVGKLGPGMPPYPPGPKRLTSLPPIIIEFGGAGKKITNRTAERHLNVPPMPGCESIGF